MNTQEKIYEEIKQLTETDAREVLDFVGYLKAKRLAAQVQIPDIKELDRFGSVFSGKFNRDECYDRQVLR